MDICMIGATPLAWLARKPEYMIFAITMTDIEKALVLKKHINFATKVPVKYHKYLDVFLRKETDKLVEYWLYNYKIILEEGKQLGFGPFYGMS